MITDFIGNTCIAYTMNTDWCGYLNYVYFNNSDMCCACGGGVDVGRMLLKTSDARAAVTSAIEDAMLQNVSYLVRLYH